MSARAKLLRGESPVDDATRAIEILRAGGRAIARYLDRPTLTLVRWHVAQRTATEKTFEEPLELFAPFIGENNVSPASFQVVAAIHERRAAWLLDQRKDPSDALTKGFAMVAEALKRNPRFPPAFATRGDLHLTRARASSDPSIRGEAAKHAKESFDEALRLNKYLARETEAARGEVDRLLDGNSGAAAQAPRPR